MVLAFRYAARSDIGLVRSDNQDSGYAGPQLLVVADGMGGHAAGDVASSVTLAELASLDSDSAGPDLLGTLSERVEAANTRLREIVTERPDLEGMGTTLTALLRSGSRLGLVHVGDSRCYLLRDGQLTRVTRDDTYVQTLIDAGQLTPEEAAHHPQRSVLTQALDGRELVVPHLSIREAQLGDRYLLCSDGLSGVVSEDTIQQTLATSDVGEVVDHLVELALRGGAPDNITCIVAEVVEVGGPSAHGAAGASRAEGASSPLVVGAASATPPGARPDEPDTPARRAASLTAAGLAASHETGTDLSGRRRAGSAGRRAGSAGRRAGSAGRGAGSAGRGAGSAGRGAGSRARWRGRRRAVATVLALAVLVGGGWWAWSWSRQQYYVGAANGSVAIYQGLSQSLGSLRLSRVHDVEEDVPLAELPTFSRQRVQDAIVARDLADARRIVAELRGLAQACQSRASLPGCAGGS